MPTVVTINGKFRLVIRTNDHEPPHVHATRGTGKSSSHAKIELDSLEISQVKNCSCKQLRLLVAAIIQHRDELSAEWERIHGKEEI